MSLKDNEIADIRTIVELVKIENIPREKLEQYVVTLLNFIKSPTQSTILRPPLRSVPTRIPNSPVVPPPPTITPPITPPPIEKHLKNCNICLSGIKTGDCKTTRCMHIFHEHCLDRWIEQCNSDYKIAKCPTCRFKLTSSESDIKLISQQNDFSDVKDYTRGEVIWRADYTNSLNRLDIYHPGTKNLTWCAHCKNHYTSHQKVVFYKDSKYAYSIHKTCERKVENATLKRFYKAYCDKKISTAPVLFSSFQHPYICNVTSPNINSISSVFPSSSSIIGNINSGWNSILDMYSDINDDTNSITNMMDRLNLNS